MAHLEKIIDDGATYYYRNGHLHHPSCPAAKFKDSTRYDWFLFGLYHRYYGAADNFNNWYIHDIKIK